MHKLSQVHGYCHYDWIACVPRILHHHQCLSNLTDVSNLVDSNMHSAQWKHDCRTDLNYQDNEQYYM